MVDWYNVAGASLLEVDNVKEYLTKHAPNVVDIIKRRLIEAKIGLIDEEPAYH